MEKTVLITGVAGFLGSQLAKDLVDAGYMVVGIDNLSEGKITNLKNLPEKQFIFKEMHSCSTKLITDNDLRKVQEIYHFASPISPKYFVTSPFETINTLTIGTSNILKLARKNKAKLVYISASETYVDSETLPLPETYKGNITGWGIPTCYDEVKHLGEILCSLFFQQYKINVRVARIFNTYSADHAQDDDKVIPKFVMQALKDENITVYGDGTQTRSFCHVTDIIHGLKLLMEKDEVSGELFHLSTPAPSTILEAANSETLIPYSKSTIIYDPLPADELLTQIPLIEKVKKLLGWESLIAISEGIEKMIEEYRKKLK